MNAAATPADFSLQLEAIKARLFYYLETFHGDRITRRAPEKITLRCPVHDDKDSAMEADTRKGTPLVHCHACNFAGSVIDLHAELHGMNPRSREAIAATAQAVGITLADTPPATQAQRRDFARQREAAQLAQARAAAETANAETLARHLQSGLAAKLAPYRETDWRAELWEASPHRLENPAEDSHHFIRGLFQPDDILWLGEPTDTGKPEHARTFRPAAEWLKVKDLPPRIAAGTFRPGTHSRSKEAVATKASSPSPPAFTSTAAVLPTAKPFPFASPAAFTTRPETPPASSTSTHFKNESSHH